MHMLAMEWLLQELKAKMVPTTFAWLQDCAARIATSADRKFVFTVFTMAIRHSGKLPVVPDPVRLAQAAHASPGWDPSDWTCDQAARTVLLLALPEGPESGRLMDELYETADVGESSALLKALPLLPAPALHMQRWGKYPAWITVAIKIWPGSCWTMCAKGRPQAGPMIHRSGGA